MEGYVLDDTIHKVDFIKKDNTTKVYTYTLDETNLMTTIEISKLDIDGNFIIGCELELYEIDEKNNLKLIDTWTTNEKTHTIKGLKVDNKYLLKEKDSADGYVISKDIGFHIKNTIDVQKVEMTDKVVEITKVDIGGEEIEGAKLQVFDEENNLVDEWISNKEPHKVNNLEEGKNYILHEEISADGYVKATDVEFTVTLEKETQKITMIDKMVEITKENIGGEEIEGTKLQVFDEDNNLVDEWISGKEPHKVNNLEEGKNYILHEEICVNGYVKATDIEFSVTLEKETQKITMIDKIVTMTKVDIGGNEIEGAEMSVTNENGEVVDSWISAKEPHHISNLEENKTYVLHELYAPDSFVIATDVEFKVTTDKETQEIVLVDKIVEMIKVDNEGNTVEGATMIITNQRTKNIVDKWVTTKAPHQINGLKEGEKYILHEEICVEGYVKATDIEFVVSQEKETQKIEMIDKVVEIVKTDLVTGEELPGAELIVTDEDGNIIDQWISTEEPHRVKGLEENKTYTLTEITCPYGFEQAESITFTVTEDKETQLIEMKDMPILSNIKIIKVDSETKEIIKSKFIFGLFADEQCTELIKEVESDKNEGTILFDNLRYNTFYIKELSAPKGYELSNDIIKLEINEEGVFANGVQLEGADKTYSFEFENVKIPEIQTGNETNYILLVSSIIISLLFITVGIVILKKKNN